MATAEQIDEVDAVDALVNLHLQVGSPCVGAAVPTAGITTDIDGNLRNPTNPDIGADELNAWAGGNIAITKVPDAISVVFPARLDSPSD